MIIVKERYRIIVTQFGIPVYRVQKFLKKRWYRPERWETLQYEDISELGISMEDFKFATIIEAKQFVEKLHQVQDNDRVVASGLVYAGKETQIDWWVL